MHTCCSGRSHVHIVTALMSFSLRSNSSNVDKWVAGLLLYLFGFWVYLCRHTSLGWCHLSKNMCRMWEKMITLCMIEWCKTVQFTVRVHMASHMMCGLDIGLHSGFIVPQASFEPQTSSPPIFELNDLFFLSPQLLYLVYSLFMAGMRCSIHALWCIMNDPTGEQSIRDN